MDQQLAHIALLVNDYDEAIDFYTQKLGFILVEDTVLNEVKRWVLVKPPGSSTGLLLAKAANDKQQTRVGDQTGGRVFLFLYTDDLKRDYKNLQDKAVKIVREPVAETWVSATDQKHLILFKADWG